MSRLAPPPAPVATPPAYEILDDFDELLDIEEYEHDAGNNAINELSRLLEAGAFD
jgi:hypothetical protein